MKRKEKKGELTVMELLIDELKIPFPDLELGRLFFSKQNIWLEEQHGFLPSNTHFTDSGRRTRCRFLSPLHRAAQALFQRRCPRQYRP